MTKRKKITWLPLPAIFFFVLLLLLLPSLAPAQELEGSKVVPRRSGRMFYISSATKTSTLSTSTVCFKSGTALATCSKKKRKRDIMTDLLDDPSVSIKPSRNSRMEEEDEVADILDQVEKSTENHRDPKFLLYWAT